MIQKAVTHRRSKAGSGGWDWDWDWEWDPSAFIGFGSAAQLLSSCLALLDLIASFETFIYFMHYIIIWSE